MRVISRRALREFWSVHPEAEGPMSAWYRVVSRTAFTCFADIKNTYRSADMVGDFVVFNVNSYRVIALVQYQTGKVFLRHVFTHAEYDGWSVNKRGT